MVARSERSMAHVHRDPDQVNRSYRDTQTLRPGTVARVAAFPDVGVPVAGRSGW
jgi:hypothetical protein